MIQLCNLFIYIYNLENILLIYKIAKEMNVTCNFLTKQLLCDLPEQTMDVLLKVRMKTGEHTFQGRCLHLYFEILKMEQ